MKQADPLMGLVDLPPEDQVEWGLQLTWGNGPYLAGYMPTETAEALIRYAVARWADGTPSWAEPYGLPRPPSVGPTPEHPLVTIGPL